MSFDYKFHELLDLLSKNNLQNTLNSNEAVEKLCHNLSWMLQEIDSDSSIIPAFLSKGILQLFADYLQKFISQFSTLSESNPNIWASFEDILEILNNFADTETQVKSSIVLQFGEDLTSYISNQLLPFFFRLKVVKFTNLLFENCPTRVKNTLYAKPLFKRNLKNILKVITLIGDYEFQVAVIECVFRTVSKQNRIKSLNILCPQEILSHILAIKDESFESDCRRVLNTFNCQQGSFQRVYSIPCLKVILGNLELHKPNDDNYKEFWIDFNSSSKRISFYCSQIIDTEDPQDTDENVWETICILKDYIQEVSSNDNEGDFLSVMFHFLPLSIELIPGITLDKYSPMEIYFKEEKDVVMKAIQEVFCIPKCSVAENQICVKVKEASSLFQQTVLIHPKDLEQNNIENYAESSVASSWQSRHHGIRKSSVPSEVMSQCSGNEFGAVKVCRKLQNSEALNPSNSPTKPSSPPKNQPKINKQFSKMKSFENNDEKKENLSAVTSKKQSDSSKPNKAEKKEQNSSLQDSETLCLPYLSNEKNLKKKQNSKNEEKQCESKLKENRNKGSNTNVFDQISSEEEDEVIPPTFETKPHPENDIQNKSLINPSIQASNKQEKMTRNLDNTCDITSPYKRSEMDNMKKTSPLVEKQSESVKKTFEKKCKTKSLQDSKLDSNDKKENYLKTNQCEKLSSPTKSSDSKKQTDNLVSSMNPITSNHETNSVTERKAHSEPSKKSTKDRSSKLNKSEKNIGSSRKGGRRLRSFDELDLLPQNYPLPKDKLSTDKNKKINPNKEKDSDTNNTTDKHLDEDNVIEIKETQPEAAINEISLIPDSFPLENKTNDQNEEEASKQQKTTAASKLLSRKKQVVDSGISSSNDSPACVKDKLTSTSTKKYSDPLHQDTRNLRSTKQTSTHDSSEKAIVLQTKEEFNEEIKKPNKTTIETEEHQTKNQNLKKKKPIPKENTESYNSVPNQEISNLETKNQVPCFVPITRDNLSKFNKERQKTLAKEHDERIEKFVEASCQNISEGSNCSPIDAQIIDSCNKIKPISLKEKYNKTGLQESTPNQVNPNRKGHLNEKSLIPSKGSDRPPINNVEISNEKSFNLLSSTKDKIPTDQKSDEDEILYQAIELGPVSVLNNNQNINVNISKQDDNNFKTQARKTSPQEKDKAPSKKQLPLIDQNRRSLDSAQPSRSGKKNNNKSDKMFTSPTEKLFKISPPKRRSLNLSLHRDKTERKRPEEKKGYDPYDFDSGSSITSNPLRESCSSKHSKSSHLSPPKKKVFLQNQNSQPSISSVTPKEKKTLQPENPKATQEESYKFGKENIYNGTENAATSRFIIVSDSETSQPKQRAKARMGKSKNIAKLVKSKDTTKPVTAKSTPNASKKPSLDFSNTNSLRSSDRKRKVIDYKEVSSIDSSISSFYNEAQHEHMQKKKKNSVNFLQNDIFNSHDKKDQSKDGTDSMYNTSHTQQSEISWIASKKNKSTKKINVEKTYASKKPTTYFGSCAFIPKRKHESPKGKKANKGKKDKKKELHAKPLSKEISPKICHKPKTNNPKSSFEPFYINSPSPNPCPDLNGSDLNKASPGFSFGSPDLQTINPKSKQKKKKKRIKEAIFTDSIEVQRAASFVMFPDDSRSNPNISKADSILQESIKQPMSSISNKSYFSDLEITLSSTEDPKLPPATPAIDSSVPSLNDELDLSHNSKLMLTPSSFLAMDDLKSNSDQFDPDKESLGKSKQAEKKIIVPFDNKSIEKINHSTPMHDYNLQLSPLSNEDIHYKSKTSFRKSLFSNPKSHNSDLSRKSHNSDLSRKSHNSDLSRKSIVVPSPIEANTFHFEKRSSKKAQYNTKVNLCQSPLYISDKSEKMTSSDEEDDDDDDDDDDDSSDSSNGIPQEMSIKRRSSNFLELSKMSHPRPHSRAGTSGSSYDNDKSIRNIVDAFSEDMKKSIQTKRQKMSMAAEEVLKVTQKALNKICEINVLKRSDLHLEFDQKIGQVIDELEGNMMNYEDHKKKTLNYFQEQIKSFKKFKDLQRKSLDKLKMLTNLYHQTINSDENSGEVQHQVENVMKNQMHRFQCQLLDQARQQEMQQVKNQLRKLLF